MVYFKIVHSFWSDSRFEGWAKHCEGRLQGRINHVANVSIETGVLTKCNI